ncbi:MAG: CbtA family protein, partial [Geminicoccales bacterium]
MLALRSIVFSSALAGLIVGGVVTVAQQFGTVPLILHAEVYEQAAEAAAQTGAAETPPAPAAHEHDHGAGAWEPVDGFERNGLTALFNVIDWIGFGLMLTGLLVLLRRPITWREGFLWGLGGFAAFMLAPGLGLPPELPGMPAAPLGP